MLRTGSAQRLSSQYFAAVPISNIAELVPSGFFSVFATLRTHFPKKNTRVYRNKHSNLRNSRYIESSRSASLEFAAFGKGSDIKHGRASAFRYFLSKNVVFAADRTHFPKKNSRVYVNPLAGCIFPFHSGVFGCWSVPPLEGADFFSFFLFRFLGV